jgi:hypothetical protein
VFVEGAGLVRDVEVGDVLLGEVPAVAVGVDLEAAVVFHLDEVLGPPLRLAAEFERQEEADLGPQVADLVAEGSVVLAVLAGEAGRGDHRWNIE